MTDLRLESHVAFLGVLVQFLGAGLLTTVFWMLSHRFNERAPFRLWGWAWIALLAALAAVMIRYSIDEPRRIDRIDLDRLFGLRVLDIAYQSAKAAHFFLLGLGTWRFARHSRAGAALAATAALLVVYVATTIVITRGLDTFVLMQVPLAVLASFGSLWWLMRLPRGRRSFGSRFTAVGFGLFGSLWCLYGIAFKDAEIRSWPATGDLLSFLAAHNSFADLIVDMLLGFGMTIMLLEQIGREKESAHQARATMKRRLDEARKLEALGNVVSGVAHELNNPLSAVLGFSDELIREPDRLRIDVGLRTIHEQALRCRNIVRDLLRFVGRGEIRRDNVRIPDLIRRVERGLEPLLTAGSVRLESRVDARMPRAMLDPTGLEQVLVNLVENAVHATLPGGCIYLSAAIEQGKIRIVVEDEGEGIPDSVMPRIFEPFFTTKAQGQGTGLGLSVAMGVVRTAGGTLTAENRESGGARFIIVLPFQPAEVAAGDLVDAGPPIARDDRDPGRSLRILVVDDERSIRQLLRFALESRGHRVFEALDGSEALLKIESADASPPFDAILSDLRMPGISGPELHRVMRRRFPVLADRLLFLTGDVVSDEAVEFIQTSGRPIITKPFEIDDVVLEIETVAHLASQSEAVRQT